MARVRFSNRGHNIQEFPVRDSPVRDSPVRDAITLHQVMKGSALLYGRTKLSNPEPKKSHGGECHFVRENKTVQF